jgi:phenylalanyl-tRNA synthetase beta chain
LKGAITSVLRGNVAFRRGSHNQLALATDVLVDGKAVGFAGQLSAAASAKVDAAGAVFVAEMSATASMQTDASGKYSEFAKFPAVTRDIAMIVPETITHENVYAEIVSESEPLLESVRLFDVFSGKDEQHLGPERKSLAYTLTYRDKSRTLTSEEVNAAHGRIRERLRTKLGAELRE